MGTWRISFPEGLPVTESTELLGLFKRLRTSRLFWKQPAQETPNTAALGQHPLVSTSCQVPAPTADAYLIQTLTHSDALVQNLLSWDLKIQIYGVIQTVEAASRISLSDHVTGPCWDSTGLCLSSTQGGGVQCSCFEKSIP